MMLDVAMIGAGPVGLACASLLPQQEISTVVDEQRATTSTQRLSAIRNQDIAFLQRCAAPAVAESAVGLFAHARRLQRLQGRKSGAA
jgi:2-polyprenyl-6-methoxyphenol hydroxylase-like FAD-dependent oxidoreductase